MLHIHNHQPLSIAVRDDVPMAPMETRETCDTDSRDTCQDYQRNCHAATTALAAGSTITTGPAWQCFVGGPHPLCLGGR